MSDATTKAKGLPAENFGLPSLNLDDCCRDGIPSDWDITDVFGDILMCKYVDENINGEILRGHIWVKKDITLNLWRVAEVVKIGPNVTGNIKIGDCLMIPGGKGIPGISKSGEKLIFVNEPRVFAKVTPKTMQS